MIINFNNLGGGGGAPSPSSSNYRVVDALSAITNPTEGLMAYVKSGEKVTNGIRVEISDWENFQKNADGNAEDFLARVHWGDWDESTQGPEDLIATQIYQSGINFFWDWNNDGNFNYKEFERDGVYYKIMYQTHNVEGNGYGSYFDFYPIDETPWGDYKFALNGNNTVSATTIQNTAIIPGGTYVYSAGQWVEIASTTFVWEDIKPSTTAETAALLEKIHASVARGIYPSILYQNHICNYSGKQSQWVNFEGVFGYNRDITFYISDQIFNENGFDSNGIRIDDHEFIDTNRYQHAIEMTSTGTFTNPDALGKFSEENHMDEIIFRINKDNGDWSQAPLKYVWRKYEEINGETKLVYYWAVEIIVDGVLYKGAWHANEGEWGNYVTDTWTAVN